MEEKTRKNKPNNIFKMLFDMAKPKKKKQKSKGESVTPQKPKAPFKVLLCITFSSNGNKIVNIFNEKDIIHSMVIKGYGTAQTSMLSMLGINETERDIVLGIVKTENSRNIIATMLEEFEKIGIKNTFCCLLSPSSANLEMIKLITGQGV